MTRGCILLASVALLGGCPAQSVDDDDDATTPEAVDEGVTWTNFAEEFFAEYCVSCHSPGGQASADYGDYDVVTAGSRPNSIRCGVAPEELDNCEGEHPPGWFPIGNGPFPTDDERWTLVEWVEDDTPF